MRYLFLVSVLVLSFFVLVIPSFVIAEKSDTVQGIAEESWNWMPKWRDQADCGPNALYVLMKLEGYNVEIEQVKKLIPLDPIKGCSMESLIRASAELGFPVEARFVKPSNLSKVSRPFILHGITSQEKNIGHFIVVVDFDKKKKNYALIDPIRETFGWNPETSVLHGYSGYVIVPKYSSNRKWNIISGVTLIVCGIGVLVLLYLKRRKVFSSRSPSGG